MKLCSLNRGVVDVWHVNLGTPRPILTTIDRDRQGLPSIDGELADQVEFARTAARHILARYLNVPPVAVRIERAPCLNCGAAHGKPRVASEALEFNLSHARGHALVAVAHRSVGVDVEPLARASEMLGMEQTIIAARDELHAGHNKGEELLRLWTAKEATAKADGRGLALAFNQMRVSGDTCETADRVWPIAAVPLVGAVGHVASDGMLGVRVRRFDSIDGRPGQLVSPCRRIRF